MFCVHFAVKYFRNRWWRADKHASIKLNLCKRPIFTEFVLRARVYAGNSPQSNWNFAKLALETLSHFPRLVFSAADAVVLVIQDPTRRRRKTTKIFWVISTIVTTTFAAASHWLCSHVGARRISLYAPLRKHSHDAPPNEFVRQSNVLTTWQRFFDATFLWWAKEKFGFSLEN